MNNEDTQRPSSRKAPIQTACIDRRQMTQRRLEFSNVIRKKRRSERVSKRRFTGEGGSVSGSVNGNDAAKSMNVHELSQFAILAKRVDRECPSSESLSALQIYLSSSNEASSQDSILKDCNGLTIQDVEQFLFPALVSVLTSDVSSFHDKLNSARILTNLFADSFISMVKNEILEQVILGVTKALSVCIAFVAKDKSEVNAKEILLLAEQLSWALGNICADNLSARIISMEKGALEILVRGQNISFIRKNAELCRNSAWALSNLARGNDISALPFLVASTLAYGYSDAGIRDDDTYLNVDIIVQMLLMTDEQNQWEEVKCDLCWLLAFLTAKEDDAVRLLCKDVSSSQLCSVLLDRFLRTYCEFKQSGNLIKFTTRVIPCIRTIGNIITSCNGVYVRSILNNQLSVPLPEMISKLVELPLQSDNFGNPASLETYKEKYALSSESMWIAGALLVDAGRVDTSEPNGKHPSTAVCQILCPSLCCIISSPTTKLDMKREATFALWNAVSLPPGIENKNYDLEFANGLLLDVARYEGLISTIAQSLLTAFDTDANLAALLLLSAMLLRLQQDYAFHNSLKRRLREMNIVESLDNICERASSSFYGGNEDATNRCAEIAANLLDDFFLDSSENGDDDLNIVPEKFSFTGEIEHTIFDPSSGSHEPSSLGRGRGRNIPAWMNK